MQKYQEALAFLENQDALAGGSSYYMEISEMLRELIHRIEDTTINSVSVSNTDPWRAESERVRRSSQIELGEATKKWSKSEKNLTYFLKAIIIRF
jgi:hypothetical protein